MKKTKIGIAMSGGVDSTATALLMQQKAEVCGFFMKLEQPNYDDQVERVSSIAEKLSINLEIIDLTKQFQTAVLDYFSGSYFKGLTPNPCVVCNREIKFGLFQKAILESGVEKMATGHYAQIVEQEGLYQLHKGVDSYKDQSYFLSRLTQDQLSTALFPLGSMEKSNIYNLVEQHGFMDFRGQESQDVCFLDHDNVADFLEKRDDFADMSGNITLCDGTILGEHKGLHRYTVGQRKGLGIAYHSPLYVIELDMKTDSVIVGTNEDLFQQELFIHDVHWLTPDIPVDLTDIDVRLRSTHRGAIASIQGESDSLAKIMFNEPQRAITPGQFAVFYKDSQVLGSGIILPSSSI